jgi:hypothetical protein
LNAFSASNAARRNRHIAQNFDYTNNGLRTDHFKQTVTRQQPDRSGLIYKAKLLFMKVQDNYMDLLEHFKVEELKERLEFDMSVEAAGWDQKAKIKTSGGGSYSSSGGFKSKGTLGAKDMQAPWGW